MEELDGIVFDALLEVNEAVTDIYPNGSVIQSTLMASYLALTPEEQVQIVEQLGADWFVKMSAKLERRLRGLTN